MIKIPVLNVVDNIPLHLNHLLTEEDIEYKALMPFKLCSENVSIPSHNKSDERIDKFEPD